MAHTQWNRGSSGPFSGDESRRDSHSQEGASLAGGSLRNAYGGSSADAADAGDHDAIVSAVADAIEQLRSGSGSAGAVGALGPEAKEQVVAELAHLAEASGEARTAIGFHAQGIPLLVGLLRSGTMGARTCAAATLGALCEQEELRVKVLLGGCIPPLLGLLRQGPLEAQLEAAEALHAVSRVALSPSAARDSVGTRIFASEGVVPALVALLQPGAGGGTPGHEDVREVLTATLRNLAGGSLPNFWRAVEREGGLAIFTTMLSSARPTAQENAAALLASYLSAPPAASHALVPIKGGHQGKAPPGGKAQPGNAAQSPAPEAAAEAAVRLVQSGTIPVLLSLMAPGREVAVRKEAAGVLRAATEASEVARQAVVEQGGVAVLIRAVVAPAQEMMASAHAQLLQENAMAALTHVAGGPREVVAFLASGVEQCREEQELAEHLGALAFALLVLQEAEDKGAAAAEPGAESSPGGPGIEQSLVRHLGPPSSALVQERAIECLGSLYACRWASSSMALPEAKRMLIGLITLSEAEGQVELIEVYRSVCAGEQSLWSALHGRDGVLHLVGLLGLSTEEQQECACALLRFLTEDAEESKWAITAAGGIPPLVSLLGTGTPRTRQDAAVLLGNLCECNEDIRACVESAEAIPALLHLLASPEEEAQATAASTLARVLPASGPSPETLGLLTELLMAEVPASKVHAVQLLGQTLESAPDVAQEGEPSYEALHTLLLLLEADCEETQSSAAAALASLLEARGELRASAVAAEAVPPLMQLVDRPGSRSALPAARALATVFSCVDGSYNAAEAAKESIYPLLKLAKCEAPGVAELAAQALGTVLSNEELAAHAPLDDVVGTLTRLLREGSEGGKRDAALGLACLMQARASDDELAESVGQHSTVLALVALLPSVPEGGPGSETLGAALSCLSVLAKHKGTASFSTSPLHALAEAPYSLGPLVSVVAQRGEQEGHAAAAAEQAVEVLSRLCKDQPVVLGDLIAGTASCTAALAACVSHSEASLEVRVGATALLICAAKEHRQSTVEALEAGALFEPLVGHLVGMLQGAPASHGPGEGESSEEAEEDPGAVVLVRSVALWLLSLLASQSARARDAVAAAGAVPLLVEKLGALAAQAAAAAEAGLGLGGAGGEEDGEEGGSAWVSSLLLSLLFCSRDVVRDPASQQAVPALLHLLAASSPSGRYFAAQALASLVSNGSRGTLLGVVAAGGVGVLLGSVARMEQEDLSHLHALADDFGLPPLPEQVALEKLFRCDDARIGPKCSAAIPELARILQARTEDLHLQQQLQHHLHLHPHSQQHEHHAGAPGASQTAALVLGLLKQLAGVSRENRVAMAAAGVVEGATKYLSSAPLQDGGEEEAVDLLRVLMTAEEEEVRGHAAVAAAGVVERLLVVLQSDQRAARLKAAGALEGLFGVDAVKHSDVALLCVGPLLAMLQGASLHPDPDPDPGHALEARAAAGALAKLAFRSSARFLQVADAQLGLFSLLLDLLARQDLSDASKEAAAVLVQGLFSTPAARARPEASLVVAPLVALLSGGPPSLQLRAAGALDMLTEDERVAEVVAGAGAVGPLVALLEGERPALHTSAVSCLFKLARDRRSCKLDIAQGGAIERITALLPAAPLPLAALAAELLRVLTNNGAIARSPAAANLVGPLFSLLARHGAEMGVAAQTSVLQTLVNVVDKPARLEAEGLTGADCMGALLPLLGSPSLLVLQLAVGLLAHLLCADGLAGDPMVARAAGPLLALVGPGQEVEGLRMEALKALEAISLHWPSAVSEGVGSLEDLARLVASAPAPVMLLAAGVVANVLRGAEVRIAQRVPLPLYIRLLLCPVEAVQLVAVQALLALLEAEAGSPGAQGEGSQGQGESVVLLCKAGLVEALLEVLRQHQPRVEEAAARLLEAVFNSSRVRSSPPVLRAIGPLAAYLMDPLTQDPSAKLLAALALGDLFQENSGVVQQSQQGDLTAVCQALLSLLSDESSEDLHMVALCGLQNLTQHSRTNKRAVADQGGLTLLMEMLPVASPALCCQAAGLIRVLLNTNTLHDHATPDLLTSLTAVLERELWRAPGGHPGEGGAPGGGGGGPPEEVLQAIEGLLHSFPKLRSSESATAAVPVLIASMRRGSEAVQEMVLNVLWMLRQGWAQSKDAARLQSTAMGEAIPLLQLMLRSGPINLYEKAEALLCALPGCLTVCLRRGSNLKLGTGVTNAYCKLTLADSAPQLTKVIQNCTDPQWRHNFVWPLDAPPRGLILHISCKNKGSLGTSSLGKASIPIDRTVALGLVSGTYTLQPDTNRDGTQRSIDVEFSWSNREAVGSAPTEPQGAPGQ